MYHEELLALRQREIIPRLRNIAGHNAGYRLLSEQALTVWWLLGDGSRLSLHANLGTTAIDSMPATVGKLLFATTASTADTLPPLSAAWYLNEADRDG